MRMRQRLVSVIGLSTVVALALQGLASPLYASTAVSQPETGALRVRITGLKSDEGAIKIAVYDSSEAYARRRGSFRKARLPIQAHASEWALDGIPAGEYAVMFYHDRNANNRLDRGLLGIPTEPFGFSNNAKPRLGPPPFEQAKFDVQGPLTTIDLAAQAAR